MFLGVYGRRRNLSEQEIVASCYGYAQAFQERFGSLRCHDLRPNGFLPSDPPHLCEALTCEAVEFTERFIRTHNENAG